MGTMGPIEDKFNQTEEIYRCRSGPCSLCIVSSGILSAVAAQGRDGDWSGSGDSHLEEDNASLGPRLLVVESGQVSRELQRLQNGASHKNGCMLSGC